MDLQNKLDMKITQHFAIVALAALFLGTSGCASATKQFSKRLRGTWNITNYDVQRPETRSTNPGQTPSLGTITFNKDGSGYTDNASIFDNLTSVQQRQGQNQYTFRWNNTDNIVVIRADGSNTPKSWIVTINEKRRQVWKTTDGANKVSTLELQRPKN